MPQARRHPAIGTVGDQDEPATNGEGDEALPAFLDDDEAPSDEEDEATHTVAAE